MAVVTADRTTSLVRLTVGDRAVGLAMDGVAGVERADRLRDGAIVTPTRHWPVYRLADLFGEPTAAADGGQVVLLDTAVAAFGLLVDRVSPVFRLPATAVRPCPPGFGRRERALYTGVALHADGPLPILSPAGLLADTPEDDALTGEFRAPAAAGDRLLAFDIAADLHTGRPLGFAVPAGWVTEIADADRLVAVPGRSHVLGLIGWRGRPVSVLDVAAWAGRGSGGPPKTVVIVRTAGGFVGLSAGRGVRVLDRSAPHVPTRRGRPLDPRRVLACVDFDDVTVAVPNLADLLSG